MMFLSKIVNIYMQNNMFIFYLFYKKKQGYVYVLQSPKDGLKIFSFLSFKDSGNGFIQH